MKKLMGHSMIKSGGLLLSTLGLLWIGLHGCKTTNPGGGTSGTKAAALPTDPELREAVLALNSIGAKTRFLDGDARCSGACHIQAWHGSIDVTKTKRWGQLMQDVNSCFTAADQIAGATAQDKAQKKIKCLLLNPADPDGGYDTPKMGFYRVGATSTFFETMFRDAYGSATDPTAHKARYDAFTQKAQMPSNSVATQAQLDVLWPWVANGMKRLDEVFGGAVDPSSIPCTDNVSAELKAHVASLNKEAGATKSWAFKNMTNNTIKMFGCSKRVDNYFKDMLSVPLDCFRQKNPTTGLDVFPLVYSVDDARTWAERYTSEGKPIDQKMRIIRKLTSPDGAKKLISTYWARSSADGRFFASGIERDPSRVAPEGSLGFVVDLADPARPIIGTSGPYDPGFFPDNKGFTFMTAGEGAFFCNQALLENPATKTIDFVEEAAKPNPFCGVEAGLGVYQHVGASPNGGSYLVIRSDNYENDNGGNAVVSDPPVGNFSSSDTGAEFWPMKESGRAFKIQPVIKVPVPFEGDYGIFPSASFMTSRISKQIPGGTDFGQGGYRIRSFDTATKTSKEVATICLKGGKVQASMNERVLAVHHYTDKTDALDFSFSPDDEEFKGMIANSSNIWIYDLYSGQKMRITRMRKGQFALYAHFRSDGWLYFLVRDMNSKTEYVVATDVAIRFQKGTNIQ